MSVNTIYNTYIQGYKNNKASEVSLLFEMFTTFSVFTNVHEIKFLSRNIKESYKNEVLL